MRFCGEKICMVLSVLCSVSAVPLACLAAGTCLFSQAHPKQSSLVSGGSACWPLLFAVHPAKGTERKMGTEPNQVRFASESREKQEKKATDIYKYVLLT